MAHGTRWAQGKKHVFDATVAVSKLGSKRQCPNANDYHLLQHVVKYLATTRTEQRHFKKYPNKPLLTSAYCDGAVGSESNGKGRISTLVLVLGNVVDHQSRSTTGTSSNEIETKALLPCTKDAVFIGRIATFLMSKIDPLYPSLGKPVPVYTDNAGALKVASPRYKPTKSTRHMLPKYAQIKQYQADGLINVVKVAGGSSDDQKADFLTKFFGVSHFVRKKRMLGIFHDPN